MKRTFQPFAIMIVFVSVVAVASSGCGPVFGPSGMPADVIRKHFEAMNREDLEEAMSHIESGPNYEITRIATEQSFKNYDLRYTVEILGYVDSDKEGEVKVKVVQTTEKIAGPMFVDNRITAYYVMKEGWFAWKIAGTEILSSERLPMKTS